MIEIYTTPSNYDLYEICKQQQNEIDELNVRINELNERIDKQIIPVL